MSGVALYTTVYPGVEPFLADWAQSVAQQSDAGFDLWVGADQITVESIRRAAGRRLDAEYVFSQPGDKPAMIRNRAIELMIPLYDAIIFVDSDDVLLPTRVRSAKEHLVSFDMAGTAMQLIDRSGNLLDTTFSLPAGTDIGSFLFSRNVFGLSNTAYRTDTLVKCLPIPADAIAADWYLATMAFLNGARIGFDPAPQMRYRQHAANTFRLIPPHTADQIIGATRLVLKHQQSVLNSGRLGDGLLRDRLIEEHGNAQAFFRSVSASREVLERYVAKLNRMPLQTLWWATVAHPALEDIWKH